MPAPWNAAGDIDVVSMFRYTTIIYKESKDKGWYTNGKELVKAE